MLLGCRQTGFAYHWVQRICGVDFKTLRAGDAVKWEDSVAAHSLGQTVSMVQERVRSRIELARQVSTALFKLFLCNHNQGFHGNQENAQMNDLVSLEPTIHGTTWPFCSQRTTAALRISSLP